MKIFGYLLLVITFLVMFGLIMFNAEDISQMKPSHSVRNRWVGELFYEREYLLFTLSLFIDILLLILLVDLIIQFCRKKFVLSESDEVLFLNGKHLINKNNIKKVETIEVNKNILLLIYFKSTKGMLNARNSQLEKIKLKIQLFLNKNKLSVNLTFLKKDSDSIQQIKKFILE